MAASDRSSSDSKGRHATRRRTSESRFDCPGVFDEKGFLKIVDRKKDMILVSGFNVFANEIEEVATACAGVAECSCVGVPDEKSGEAVKLFVVKSKASTIDEADVIGFCRKELTGYKVPKIVRFVDALPKSTVGKIPRRELRDVARDGLCDSA